MGLFQKSSTVFPDLEKIKDPEIKQVLSDLFKVLQGSLTDGYDDANQAARWAVDGTETQLVTADEVDMQSKKIINVTDPAAAQDAATKASSESYADGKLSKTTAGEINAMTEKTTLADNDLFLIEDSAAGNAKKKVKRSNVIATTRTSAVGDILTAKADTEIASAGASYVKVKEILVPFSGSLRIKFDLKSSGGGNTNGRIYRNGVAVGTERVDNDAVYTTYSEDISGWTAGDLCQLYIQEAAVAGAVKNFRIYEAIPIDYVVITD